VWDGNEMNVIGHQAIADQFYPVSLYALLQQGEIDAPLSITFKDDQSNTEPISQNMT
jgi:hypothetical protein